ncbi:MAG: hypothetical protein MMC33_003611 [Icmadophila ericetorum]|nr:hypothetical protein [Icmadophila ericetorum]
MALPAAKHNVGIEDLTEREAGPLAEAEKETAADDPVRRTTVFGRRVRVDKPGTPVKAMVRSPDREVSGAKGKEE